MRERIEDMVKGTQRQMVMVRTSDSNLFEMAYFVLRTDTGERTDGKSMIAEANSIVSAACADASASKREKNKRTRRRMGLFLLGALFGAALFGAVMLIALIF